MSKKERAAKVTEKRRFAALYVNGPEHLKGNQEAIEAVLGAKIDMNDADTKLFIEHEGGPAAAPVLSAAESGPRTEPALAVDVPSADATPDEWKRRADAIMPQLVAIAAGTVKASAAQVSAAKEIVSRAYGRVAERDTDKRPAAGILVLPALGDQRNLTVCPRCSLELSGESPCKSFGESNQDA